MSDETLPPIPDPMTHNVISRAIEKLRREMATEHKLRATGNKPKTKRSIWWSWGIMATIFFAWMGLSTFFYFNPMAGKSVFLIGQPFVAGSAELCPGESLVFSASIDVERPGVYLLDMSTWRVDPPPATVIFSEGDRMVIGDERSFIIARKWTVPANYIDPATNAVVDWWPGKYTRDIAVTAVGLSTLPSTQVVEFTIREGCES